MVSVFFFILALDLVRVGLVVMGGVFLFAFKVLGKA
jgi:hypothetical protein